MTLSYDLTFLSMLLNALYEPGESPANERCAFHPIKPHAYITHDAVQYAADMNLALAYFKSLDNWHDDRNPVSAVEARRLKRGYDEVMKRHPEKCGIIAEWIRFMREREAQGADGAVDALANATGEMLGSLFMWREGDLWNDDLRAVGDGLGRFIYLMDAYDDLPSDARRRRFNALKPLADSPGFETLCRDAMLQAMADATNAFERLPIVLDADLLRNVLYSGVWLRYNALERRRKRNDKGEN